MRILVAEDELINQKVIAALLRKLGCEVTIAADGKQAVDAFATQDFDLVFMDIQMPEVDGFEATRLIRKKEQRTGRRVPIVACTAHAINGYRDLCFAAGMDGYMTKPIDRQELMETVAYFSSVGLPPAESLEQSLFPATNPDFSSLVERKMETSRE